MNKRHAGINETVNQINRHRGIVDTPLFISVYLLNLVIYIMRLGIKILRTGRKYQAMSIIYSLVSNQPFEQTPERVAALRERASGGAAQ